MLVKWLRSVLEIVLMYVCHAEITVSATRAVYVTSKQNRASAPFIQSRAEHAGFIFK